MGVEGEQTLAYWSGESGLGHLGRGVTRSPGSLADYRATLRAGGSREGPWEERGSSGGSREKEYSDRKKR
ncbi:hypothetical protein E2C01_094743 [Portunus trituberculatus]|uniref:Uncharacterized protein n=1 Tax=Portunus trituberculatus TaxID=210409 RepID=A0A5B7JXP7_PORTR|nr:hypothetical protein [Portunus trituberculatus]